MHGHTSFSHDPKYSNRQIWANSVDPDQTATPGSLRVYTVCHSFCNFRHIIVWATSWENLFMPYANNRGTDQLEHLHSLISTFVVCCLYINTKWICPENSKDYQRVFDTDSSALCPHLSFWCDVCGNLFSFSENWLGEFEIRKKLFSSQWHRDLVCTSHASCSRIGPHLSQFFFSFFLI